MSINSINIDKIVVLKDDKVLKPGEDFIIEDGSLHFKFPPEPHAKISIRKLKEGTNVKTID
tara:strand:- start:153 stop:335 length:183 start_codon:yes stop_codon:yes gene_type:complete